MQSMSQAGVGVRAGGTEICAGSAGRIPLGASKARAAEVHGLVLSSVGPSRSETMRLRAQDLAARPLWYIEQIRGGYARTDPDHRGRRKDSPVPSARFGIRG